jgi:pimeloyl-ACP methyl ester carboxylesterase
MDFGDGDRVGDRGAGAGGDVRTEAHMDLSRRKLLVTGALATAMAQARRVFGLQVGRGGAAMSFYERGPVRIHYEESGSGFPLLLIAGGGLNSTIAGLTGAGSPFNPIAEFRNEFRCIASDLRNANSGQSSGPLEIDRPWDAYTDDHIGLMDHLRIDRFMVLGFCIGGPFIWNLLKRAPNRVVAAVLAQPSGSRPEARDLFYETNIKGWGPELVKRRPEITMEMVDRFLTKMYRNNPDFVFTVTRDFVRTCQTPVLILPDDIPAHPYAVAMEAAMLAPKSEVSIYPWKEPKERIPLAVRQIRSFLRAHRPAAH